MFYGYWFNGRRLLDAPLEAMLADPELDFPFCLMWANENWTRRWDGSDHQVLLSQDYRDGDEAALLAWFARCFADRRYIRLGGRPVLMIYRPRLIPDTANTIARWRRRFASEHGEDPFLVMAQSFGDTDPRPLGLDAAVEFPPHKLTERLGTVNAGLQVLDPRFSAEVYDYAAVAAASVAEPAPPFPLIKTAVPGWDNDARRQGAGAVLHGATPVLYQSWLEKLVQHARAHPVGGESLVCVNAWNEWAEGAYLEPDVHWGAAFLNATGRAVAGLAAPGTRSRILLVGHDGLDHGAQRLLLHIGRTLRRAHGVDVAFLLLGGGPMEELYRAVGPVRVVAAEAGLDALVRLARDAGCGGAIVNTAAAAAAVPVLAQHGIGSTLLVHELPRLIRQYRLLPALRQAVACAGTVVFPAAFVRDRCRELLGTEMATAAVLPQGLYADPAPGGDARAALRHALHVPDDAVLAVGVGYADLRKGFDLFLQAWRLAQNGVRPVCMVWAGGIDPAVESYLGVEMAGAEASGSFRYLGPREDVPALLEAADVFLLTSREDPLPSAALEALATGVPVVAFAEAGGIPEVLARLDGGCSVTLGDAGAMVEAALRLAGNGRGEGRAVLARRARQAFRFDAYAAGLLRLARPSLLPVSVAVLSHDYARFLPDRLGSVFNQSYPVWEVLLLDDASADDSVAVAAEVAARWDRTMAVDRRTVNSGSVFAQWRRAAERATGEWLWLAEADDSCDPLFLDTLVAAIRRAGNPVLAFCDSRAIDAAGASLWDDHKAYYGADVLAEDAVLPGRAFLAGHLAERNLILNASAVLWRRDALLAALDRCGTELDGLHVAGDWRIYAEVLSEPGAEIVYVAQPLNHHRRHAGSVTARQPRPAHIAEIGRVHGAIERLLGADPALRRRQQAYRRSLRQAG